MTTHELRDALRKGRRVFATCVTTPSPRMPAMLRQAGCDFAFIENEHTPLGREMIAWMCQAYAAAGVPPVVRVPSPDPFEVAKVIDGGAAGIIGPYIETPEQVQALVGAVRYRPLKGQRLQRALKDPKTLEPEVQKYLDARNQGFLLILNIESVPAIENLDAMLSIPGVDAALIGPHDLSCSLGIPERYDHPRFEEAVTTIIRTARAHNVGAGFHFWEDIEREISWAKSGANLIIHSADITFVRQHLKRELDSLRAALGDDRPVGSQQENAIV